MFDLWTPRPSNTAASGVAAALMAHERRRPGRAAFLDTGLADVKAYRDHIPDQIATALRARRIRVFDIRTAAVIGPTGVEGRVRLRIDDGRWSLATLEAAVVALVLEVQSDLPHAALYAEAFRRGAVEAEGRVEAVHERSHQIRPTQDLEDVGVRA